MVNRRIYKSAMKPEQKALEDYGLDKPLTFLELSDTWPKEIGCNPRDKLKTKQETLK